MATYAIRTNTRYGDTKYQYLCTNKHSYWTTDDPTHLRKFTSHFEALKVKSMLKFNNPTIVPYNVALLDLTTGIN